MSVGERHPWHPQSTGSAQCCFFFQTLLLGVGVRTVHFAMIIANSQLWKYQINIFTFSMSRISLKIMLKAQGKKSHQRRLYSMPILTTHPDALYAYLSCTTTCAPNKPFPQHFIYNLEKSKTRLLVFKQNSWTQQTRSHGAKYVYTS